MTTITGNVAATTAKSDGQTWGVTRFLGQTWGVALLGLPVWWTGWHVLDWAWAFTS